MLDRGIGLPQSITRARREIKALLEDGASEISKLFHSMLAQLYAIFRTLNQQIASFDDEIEKVFRSSETCRRLAKIRGVGPKSATAIVAAMEMEPSFANGRASRCVDGSRAPSASER